MLGGSGGGPERRTFSRGTVIFREGDPCDTAYLLLQGGVRIFKTIAGRRVTLGLVRPPQVFGEVAMIDDACRIVGAVADEDSVCLGLTRPAIRLMMDQAPEGLNTLVLSLLATMRAMESDLAEAHAALTALAAGESPLG